MDDTRYWKLEFMANEKPVVWITKTTGALLKHAQDSNPDILFLGGHHNMWQYTEAQLHWILAGGVFKAHLLYDLQYQSYRDFSMTEIEPVEESDLDEVTRLGNGFAFPIWRA